MTKKLKTDFYGKEITLDVDSIKNSNDAEVIFDAMASTIAVKVGKLMLKGFDDDATDEERADAKDLLKTSKDYIFKKKPVQIEQTQIHKYGEIEGETANEFMAFIQNKRKTLEIEMEDAEIVTDNDESSSEVVLNDQKANTELD